MPLTLLFDFFRLRDLPALVVSAALINFGSPLPPFLAMSFADEAVKAYRLVPFIRAWASTPDKVRDLRTVFDAMEMACNLVVTPVHWASCAIVCSVLTRVTFLHDPETDVVAEQWLFPKPYPPAVHTVVLGLAVERAQAWLEGAGRSVP